MLPEKARTDNIRRPSGLWNHRCGRRDPGPAKRRGPVAARPLSSNRAGSPKAQLLQLPPFAAEMPPCWRKKACSGHFAPVLIQSAANPPRRQPAGSVSAEGPVTYSSGALKNSKSVSARSPSRKRLKRQDLFGAHVSQVDVRTKVADEPDLLALLRRLKTSHGQHQPCLRFHRQAPNESRRSAGRFPPCRSRAPHK